MEKRKICINNIVVIKPWAFSKNSIVLKVYFVSVVAHGNFSIEEAPTTPSPVAESPTRKNNKQHQSKLPISTSKYTDPAYMATIVGGLAALILLLGVGIYLTVNRFRQRKYFSSSHSSKCGFSGASHHLPEDSVCGAGMSEKGNTIAAYGVTEIDECKRSCVGSVTFGSSTRSTLPVAERYLESSTSEYQEPYQALRYAPYYSYSPVVMEMQDMMSAKCLPTHSGMYI